MTFRALPRHFLFAALSASLLAACGGSDNAAGGGGTTVTIAPLVVSAAAPVAYNGTLAKTNATFEHGSSNAGMTTYLATDDYCRVGAYVLKNSVTSVNYFVEISFRKDTKAVGKLNFGADDGSFTALASALGPIAGVAVDITNRRLGFTNVTLTTGAVTVTLNGSLEYPTNIDPTNRASCG